MKLFLTGISGLLGLNFALQTKELFEVSGCFNSHPVNLLGVDQFKLDLNSHSNIVEVIDHVRPDVIVHTAALTNVDYCETNFEHAKSINVDIPVRLAKLASESGIQFIHISTDQLFDGNSEWYAETDDPSPLNNYGITKLMAENEILRYNPESLIIRTNFFGWGTSLRTSFSDWILAELNAAREIRMFTDVYFTPILINQLVDFAIELVGANATGVFHVAGADRLSKYEFALNLAEIFDLPDRNISPISVDQFKFEAPRPKNMSLCSDKVESLIEMTSPQVLEGIGKLRELGEAKWPNHLQSAISI